VKRAIPLHIGGASEAAVRRAAQRGDGFFPFVFPGQDPHVELPKLIGRVRAATERAGRDPLALELTAGGARTPDEAAFYADLGISRLTVAVRARTIDEMRDEVAQLADELLAPTAGL
jgi:alkanesulfonate monooxygenase SsuD/methylene tetrahydromethanopterin reductase-like flavin-dependent oxidoreductase (luciferase family)